MSHRYRTSGAIKVTGYRQHENVNTHGIIPKQALLYVDMSCIYSRQQNFIVEITNPGETAVRISEYTDSVAVTLGMTFVPYQMTWIVSLPKNWTRQQIYNQSIEVFQTRHVDDAFVFIPD